MRHKWPKDGMRQELRIYSLIKNTTNFDIRLNDEHLFSRRIELGVWISFRFMIRLCFIGKLRSKIVLRFGFSLLVYNSLTSFRQKRQQIVFNRRFETIE